MKYIIGIDGGGTKTDIIISDEKLNITAQMKGGPSNFISEGKEKTIQVLADLIEEITSDNNIKNEDILAVCAGIAGAGRKKDRLLLKEGLLEELRGRNKTIKRLIIETDGRIALEGAHSGKEGCVLIAGTGSIIFGKIGTGELFRAGGFGRIIGDQGSAYMIGRKAFALLGESLDKRTAENLLTNMLMESFSINNEDDLIDSVYKNNIYIASAAPLVLKAASLRDESSVQILEEETDELLKHIAAALLRFGKEFNLSLTGGLFENDNIFSEMFKDKLASNYPQVKIKKPDHPSVLGAVLLSRRSRSED